MNLYDNPDYQSAVAASAQGDLEKARGFYQQLLDDAEAKDDVHAISHLMHALGDLEARDGNLKLGHELHLRALGQSPFIPLNFIAYAKGLVRHFQDNALAEHQLVKAEKLIESDNWDQVRDGISAEEYGQLIKEIRSEYSEP